MTLWTHSHHQMKWTLLHHAAMNGRLALCQPLIGMGAIVNARDDRVSESTTCGTMCRMRCDLADV